MKQPKNQDLNIRSFVGGQLTYRPFPKNRNGNEYRGTIVDIALEDDSLTVDLVDMMMKRKGKKWSKTDHFDTPFSCQIETFTVGELTWFDWNSPIDGFTIFRTTAEEQVILAEKE